MNQHHDHHHHSSADKPIGIITDRLIVTVVGLITDKKPSKIQAEGLMRGLDTKDTDIAEAAKLLQIMASTDSG